MASSRLDDVGQVFGVVMAGGQGTRLWPLSREAFPKQFLSVGKDGATLLQETVHRAVRVLGTVERVLVIAQEDQEPLVRQQLPDLPQENLILEPTGRNTAACLALAAIHLQRRSPGMVMAVFPSDHLYTDEQAWIEAVRAAIAFASGNDHLVTIGIPPTASSSNYGYLQVGQVLGTIGDRKVFKVLEFVEKPSKDRANQFIKKGGYFWNTGTFAWQVEVFLEALKRDLPNIFEGLALLNDDPDALSHLYTCLESISVDYGVMEREKNVAVVQGEFHRIDVGTLANLSDVWPADPNHNSILGETLLRDSQGNIVYSDDGLVALIGMQNTIVIRQGDVVLVCPIERAAQVKDLVNDLDKKGLGRYR